MPTPEVPEWLRKKITEIPKTEPAPIEKPKVDPWETDPNKPKEKEEKPPGETKQG